MKSMFLSSYPSISNKLINMYLVLVNAFQYSESNLHTCSCCYVGQLLSKPSGCQEQHSFKLDAYYIFNMLINWFIIVYV